MLTDSKKHPNRKKLNVLSLFDGMSCGRIALERNGQGVNKYYASEIDKYAISVSRHNYPDIIQLGDINNWTKWDIDWANIDLILAGSPCQGFSSLGDGLAFDDPRSGLFFVFVDILNHVKSLNPRVLFLLENVKMKQKHLDVITAQVNTDPIFVNSSDYSFCSRPRNYWFNWHTELPVPQTRKMGEVIDYSLEENVMSESWHNWWAKNSKYQLKKKFSKIITSNTQGIAMTTRQYASWNGNFIPCPSGKMRKPTKAELARLVGAPENYFETTSQRQAEVMTGNGWTVDVICHILKGMPNV